MEAMGEPAFSSACRKGSTRGTRLPQIRAHLHGYPQTVSVERMTEKRGEEGAARLAVSSGSCNQREEMEIIC